MAKCIGCGKTVGGLLGGFNVKIMSGQMCLTCKGKVSAIPSYHLLSAEQIRDVIAGKLAPIDAETAVQQRFPGNSPTVKQEVSSSTSSADEIRKLKELYDEGIITSEEFQQAKARELNR